MLRLAVHKETRDTNADIVSCCNHSHLNVTSVSNLWGHKALILQNPEWKQAMQWRVASVTQ